MVLTLEQVLRNALEAEQAAAGFYNRLAEKAADAEAEAFCREMAAQEVAHARAIEKTADELKSQALPPAADQDVSQVEAAPAWEAAEEITYQQGLEIALEAEQHAASYYAAVADGISGAAVEFLRELAIAEERHAERIRALLRRRS